MRRDARHDSTVKPSSPRFQVLPPPLSPPTPIDGIQRSPERLSPALEHRLTDPLEHGQHITGETPDSEDHQTMRHALSRDGASKIDQESWNHAAREADARRHTARRFTLAPVSAGSTHLAPMRLPEASGYDGFEDRWRSSRSDHHVQIARARSATRVRPHTDPRTRHRRRKAARRERHGKLTTSLRSDRDSASTCSMHGPPVITHRIRQVSPMLSFPTPRLHHCFRHESHGKVLGTPPLVPCCRLRLPSLPRRTQAPVTASAWQSQTRERHSARGAPVT